MFEVKIDPSRLANPDLDIRYRLFDYLDELYPDALKDDGYDYEGSTLVVFIGLAKELVGLQLESITDSIVSYSEFGDDFKDAIELYFDGRLLYAASSEG